MRLLEIRGLHRSFYGIRALDGVARSGDAAQAQRAEFAAHQRLEHAIRQRGEIDRRTRRRRTGRLELPEQRVEIVAERGGDRPWPGYPVRDGPCQLFDHDPLGGNAWE